ncbi:predicted protein [Pyrenophora tritici-repentis Pt-1C-BFP]|uniref:Uncharacterized protein n=1 Tax=Pyrenophora tritici-repentis (strain Pt-1C-BFP) TaxID=426418 RepID=B2W9J4_PYRTR|nr:uncharacterized protein PTRG_06652 [Pyrenophora tritici-repentis Pt-1C-BFP]EDU49572.1 predicted protein [Pyrenophora tritici-repentis Pt-1C-BFP]
MVLAVLAQRSPRIPRWLTREEYSSVAPFLRLSDGRAHDDAGLCEGSHYDLREHDMIRTG